MSSIWRQIADMPVLPKQISTRGDSGLYVIGSQGSSLLE